jgi:hypothetical protein
MPRVLLSSAHIAPLILDTIGFEHEKPRLAASYPLLPKPFHVTAERVARLQDTDTDAITKSFKERCETSAKKSCCDAGRIYTLTAPLYSNDRM